jgi:hypothetical protein
MKFMLRRIQHGSSLIRRIQHGPLSWQLNAIFEDQGDQGDVSNSTKSKKSSKV